MFRLRFGLIALAMGGLLLGLAARALAADREFTVRGVVRGAWHDGAITIQHEDIPGFMPAMTMPFYTDAPEARTLVVGDRVEFTFRVGERSRASAFRKVGRETPAPTPAPPPSRTARLRPGDALPEFQLVDQDGAPLTRESLRGRPTVLTFIFTRCPIPEFCPLVGKKFQQLQEQLAGSAGASGARLLSVTLDPDYDQPPVLRRYGESLGADATRWTFATGDRAEIKKLTQAFAVYSQANPSGGLDHTLATALIDADGKVVEIWRGNAWKPDEVLARLAPRDSSVGAR